MSGIREQMGQDHRQCDHEFVAVENALHAGSVAEAKALFQSFAQHLIAHFDAEEAILFTAFEDVTGMTQGPTYVMRTEHAQMRELLETMRKALEEADLDSYSGEAETLFILMQQHNMKEESILYPMCDTKLARPTDFAQTLMTRIEQAVAV